MENNVLAVVAGYEITEAELNTFMKGLPREQQMYASHPQFRQQCLENLMAIRMFAAEALEAKIDETEEFKKAMESARTEILAQLAVAHVMKALKVEEEELKAYYEANLSQFEKDATAQAVFDVEWELFQLYEELGMQEEKQGCGEALLRKIEQLDLNEYIRDVYTKKIRES